MLLLTTYIHVTKKRAENNLIIMLTGHEKQLRYVGMLLHYVRFFRYSLIFYQIFYSKDFQTPMLYIKEEVHFAKKC